jgi:hypothetical protein
MDAPAAQPPVDAVVELLGVSREQAEFLLEACGGDIEAAAHMYYGEAGVLCGL